MERLIIIGAGGYAKSVIDSIDFYNYELIGFLDEYSHEKSHLGIPILASNIDELKNPEQYVYLISFGNNINRKRWYDILVKKGLKVINVVDRSAIISSRAILGNGCFVGKFAVINSKAVIGNNCIINSRALIEHGCVVSDHVNLSTNTVINGDVQVGTGSFIGSCSVTIGQLKIGCWSTVGAGAVVIKNVADGVTVAGVPAKEINKGAMLG